MSREDYVELVRELCEELDLDDAGELLDRGLLMIDDTLVGIEYLEQREEVRLLADLGEIDAAVDRNAMLALLLEANLGNTSFCLPTFSLHPETGHPVVAYHLPMEALHEEGIDLAYVLKDLLIPMLDEWKAAVVDSMAEDASGATASAYPGGLA
ncbi:CesT family type III secretion system chaperone [Variovorax sp. KK3]|uniref:CesT family type III secretion system chaperone n=1 Tax=Variovorax sp. KK3 TaxID=1855728 RepID=UPI00097C4F3F|nr:CesT family type III secretion system chaperone [Variovorax sp. KK3]